MLENDSTIEKVILCGVHTGAPDSLSDTTEESMAELRLLADTVRAEVVGEMVQNKDHPEAATYFGEGKLEELRIACSDLGASLIIFDDSLSGSQIRNIEGFTGVRVIDRSMLILDIFAQRATSKEGKIQVELAQLKYNLPRLSGTGTSLSRLGGGIGTRGPGETKLESDRRHIYRRINALEEELCEIQKHRDLLRVRRTKENAAVAALVGYTNAGKSTLLNQLTNAGVLAADMLFATLDPTVRKLELPDGRNAVIVDTVGFIRKLPHHLIEAFKSTLDEAVLADVLVHVIDSSCSEMENQMKIVDDLVLELGCRAKRIIAVFNKSDIAPKISPRPKGIYTDYVDISAKSGEGIGTLIDILSDALPGKKKEISVLIPYSDSKAAAQLHDGEVLISEEYTPEGTLIKLLADCALCSKLQPYITGE